MSVCATKTKASSFFSPLAGLKYLVCMKSMASAALPVWASPKGEEECSAGTDPKSLNLLVTGAKSLFDSTVGSRGKVANTTAESGIDLIELARL